ncbi:hypothetical protein LXT21_34750 [Myxococcus sp. K38C18041901]|uniref:hypothetical protein n=1 Tax=Myxococcus guangdongensis TaxID=2906760 RepID=UPI0020A756A0|nr:hypothetical protein [Myxococcus guangdongensis]MCP3063950.1 hypothetical protein [Myxococcus guangdongensis]
MKTWLAVTLGAVVGLAAAVVPPAAVAGASEQEHEQTDPSAYPGPCFLELICPNGSVLRCNGAWECDYGGNWIRCDGAAWGCDGTST